MAFGDSTYLVPLDEPYLGFFGEVLLLLPLEPEPYFGFEDVVGFAEDGLLDLLPPKREDGAEDLLLLGLLLLP